MLIVGCDIGSETHYVRAIDTRGRELSSDPFSFSNSKEGFESAKRWMLELAAENDKNQIVLGLEPTGHYWFCLASWMISNGISVVQVNPYAVKQTKEIEDNSQRKDDRKDPEPIANLVKDGNFGIPYIPEGLYAEIRGLSALRDQLMETRIQAMNRLHREMKIYFPEYKDAFGKMDGDFTLEVLRNAPFPDEINRLGEDGLKDLWHKAKLRDAGYRNAGRIIRYAENSVGLDEGNDAAKEAVRWFTEQIVSTHKEPKKIENTLHQKCCEIPHVDNVLEHVHYTTRAENPPKKMQSLIAIACKLLRVICTRLLTGRKYDPERMLRDIRYPEPSQAKAA